MPAYTGASCATNPTFASCPAPAAGAPPATWIRPAVGGSIPVIMLSSVVLPAPFGLTRPAIVPAGTVSEQSASAHLSPYFFPRPSVWITASISCPPLRDAVSGLHRQDSPRRPGKTSGRGPDPAMYRGPHGLVATWPSV